jgi:hypothetical protein
MFHALRHTALLALLGASVLAAACGGKSINHVLSDPSQYRNREVSISGRVVDSYSVAGRGVYLIEDRTGQLWVASAAGVPRRGARVTVRGRIQDGFNLGRLGGRLGARSRIPIDGVVMLESSHKAR